MDPSTQQSEAAFSAYVDRLDEVIGHADRVVPLRDYCLGLLMPLERKSVEPMAAVTARLEPQQSISPCCILSGRRPGRTRR